MKQKDGNSKSPTCRAAEGRGKEGGRGRAGLTFRFFEPGKNCLLLLPFAVTAKRNRTPSCRRNGSCFRGIKFKSRTPYKKVISLNNIGRRGGGTLE